MLTERGLVLFSRKIPPKKRLQTQLKEIHKVATGHMLSCYLVILRRPPQQNAADRMPPPKNAMLSSYSCF